MALKEEKLRKKRFARNIFVTQLNDGDYQEYAMIPVVKEAAERLLISGRNTLQHTLLLQKELEAEQVDSHLASKKAQFTERLAACAERKHSIMVKQQELREVTTNAADLIDDQNRKQRRALRRCENDAKERVMLERNLSQLGEIATQEISRRRLIKQKLGECKQSAEFLQNVVNALPADYITLRDDPIKGLMDRHSYLVSTKRDLTVHSEALSEELKSSRTNIRQAEIDHGFNLLELNGKLGRYQLRYEGLKSKTSTLDSEAEYALRNYKNRVQYAGDVLRAVDSLVERCGGTSYVIDKGNNSIENERDKSFVDKVDPYSHLRKTGMDVLLNGISSVATSQNEIVDEAKRIASRPERKMPKKH